MSHPDRILIIEDDPDQRSLLRNYMGMMGYESRAAENGEEALAMLDEFRPTVVLLDLYLPSMPGMQVLQEIASRPATEDVPVLIMSADNSEETMIVALSSGASDYIVKPLRMAELTPKLQNQIELYKSRRALKGLNEKLEREKSLLSRYFSMDVVEKILSEEISPRLGGQRLPASMLFFDIRNSTGIAEHLDPEVFSDFLSMVLTDVMDLVFGSMGSVNKLTGDGLLATFGCPSPTDHDARNALSCALRIRDYIQIFNNSRPEYLRDPLGIGIGIATGEIFAGNVGSYRRMEYTVLGDGVNLASRLEALNKELHTTILLDEATLRAAGSDGFIVRDAGLIQIRGKEEQVKVYSLEALAAPVL